MRSTYDAVRDGVAVQIRRGRQTVTVSGRDAGEFLHRMLSNDIQALKSGAGCYATLLTAQGRMIADMSVTRTPSGFLLDSSAIPAPSLASRIERFHFRESLTIEDASERMGCVGVHGVRAPEVLGNLFAIPLERLRGLHEHSVMVPESRGDVLVIAARTLGCVGFHVYVPIAEVGGVLDRLQAAGAVELENATATALRIEAGVPSFPEDMNQETIPLEAGIEDRAVSQTKGCYPGQEIITRVLHRGGGRLSRRLVGLRFDARAALVTGARVLVSSVESGHITSACISPALDCAIALAYVKWDHREPGTPVSADTADGSVSGRVHALPFVPLVRAGAEEER